MKSFNRISAVIIALIAVIFISANIFLLLPDNSESGRPYRVEISRIALEIEENGFDKVDLSEYQYVTDVERFSADDSELYTSDSDYAVREIGGEFYRFEYTVSAENNSRIIFTVNTVLAIMTVLIIGVLIFICRKILNPFDILKEIPYELSKGNLTVPVKENKNRFFGRFIWGVDLLRENMEQQKQRELELQKDKKTLLLSLSHDIKTPLSAIKLYSKALSKGLYSDKRKELEIAESINTKADEIEGFISEIIKASSEDFLHLEVCKSEFYLSQAVDEIKKYYTEKLPLIGTDFSVSEYSDCILKGDLNRLVEVLQNIIENAVKYGDGHSISLDFSEEEDCKLIAVRNSGCTLSDTELPHIFDSFWRGSNVGSNTGSGLGLYICRQLMRKMDGEVFAEIKNGYMCVTVVTRKDM